MSLQITPFLERLIRFLIPFFSDVAVDAQAIRTEILETLESYGARSRSELLNAAQIIAFGMASLDMIHQAKTTEMSPSMRLRFTGCANNLTRNSQKQEAALNKRLACDKPGAAKTSAKPNAAASSTEPVNDVSDDAADITLEQVRAEMDKIRYRFFGKASIDGPTAKQDAEKRARGMSVLDILAEEMDLPADPFAPCDAR